MLKLPKLIVETPDFDLVRYFFSRGDNLVIIEGQVVSSYDDFVKLCSQEPYKDKDFLKVSLFPVADGG